MFTRLFGSCMPHGGGGVGDRRFAVTGQWSCGLPMAGSRYSPLSHFTRAPAATDAYRRIFDGLLCVFECHSYSESESGRDSHTYRDSGSDSGSDIDSGRESDGVACSHHSTRCGASGLAPPVRRGFRRGLRCAASCRPAARKKKKMRVSVDPKQYINSNMQNMQCKF